jgi:hypothetical protein
LTRPWLCQAAFESSGWPAERYPLDCARLSIALREGPYDWEALEAFAAEVVRPG